MHNSIDTVRFLYENFHNSDLYTLEGMFSTSAHDQLMKKLRELFHLKIGEYSNLLFSVCMCFEKSGIKEYICEDQITKEMGDKIENIISFYRNFINIIDDTEFNPLLLKIDQEDVFIIKCTNNMEKFFILLGGKKLENSEIHMTIDQFLKVDRDSLRVFYDLIKG